MRTNGVVFLGQRRRNVDGTKKRTSRHCAGRDSRLHGKERKAFRSIQKMHAIRYNEDKLKVIGSLLPSNNVDERGPLLQVLDMLEDVDILTLSHTCSAMRGMLQQYLACYYKGKKPALQLACGIGSDAFESRLEDAGEFALEQIWKV